jgi:hypothetical protein
MTHGKEKAAIVAIDRTYGIAIRYRQYAPKEMMNKLRAKRYSRVRILMCSINKMMMESLA